MINRTIKICLLFISLMQVDSIAFAQLKSEKVNNICGITSANSIETCKEVQDNIFSLVRAGKIAAPKKNLKDAVLARTTALSSPIRFKWPVKSKNAEQYAYSVNLNFLDLDTTYTIVNGDTTFHIKDYMGGNHTYDGHNGLDILIGPYFWERKKNADVFAIAAAPGTIVARRDGGFDGNCDIINPPWVGVGAAGNYVAVLHADNSTVSYYKHLKNGSVTSKQIGEYVNAGEYMGAVASSGRSTAPHLHFEVHIGWDDPQDPDGILVEPFAGPYNSTVTTTLWENQPDYTQPEIMSMETHWANTYSDYPDFYLDGCDSTINLGSLNDRFQPGQFVATRTHIKEWTNNMNISFWIEDPNGLIKDSWTASNPDTALFTSRYHNFFIPANATEGTWQLNLALNGKTYSHYFTVGDCNGFYVIAGPHTNNKGYIVSNYINSTATIAGSSNNNIEYHADSYVVLNPGFTASSGCTFKADTKGCANGQ